MKTKKDLINYLKNGGLVKIVKAANPNHRFFGIVRKAEKVMSTQLKFEGGSYLSFKDIDTSSISDSGFSLKPFSDGVIPCVYEFVNS